jgi:hypothetical protein
MVIASPIASAVHHPSQRLGIPLNERRHKTMAEFSMITTTFRDVFYKGVGCVVLP